MIKNKPLGRTLLLALALVVFLAASGNAAEDEASAEGFESCQVAEQGSPAPGPDGARAEGHRHSEGRMQPPGRCPHDELHGGGHLREPEPPRHSPRLHDQVRGHPAAARQAAGGHARQMAPPRSSTMTARR